MKKIKVLLMTMMVAFGGCSAKESEASKSVPSATPEIVQETSTPEPEPTEVPKEKVELQVFIAASLKNAMTEIQGNYKALHPEVEIVFNADSSGTLQKQIEEGGS